MPIKIIDVASRRPGVTKAASGSHSRDRRDATRLIKDPPTPLLHADGSLSISPDLRTDDEIIKDMRSRFRVQSLQSFQFIEQFNNRRKDDMPVRTIDVSARLMPRSGIGKFAQLEEVRETMAALNNLPINKAIQIDMDPTRYATLKKDGVKDPARSIVNVLRRKFISGGLPFKAYAVDDKTITVMREEGTKKLKK